MAFKKSGGEIPKVSNFSVRDNLTDRAISETIQFVRQSQGNTPGLCVFYLCNTIGYSWRTIKNIKFCSDKDCFGCRFYENKLKNQ